MRISDWSSDVCSSDLLHPAVNRENKRLRAHLVIRQPAIESPLNTHCPVSVPIDETQHMRPQRPLRIKALFLPGELYRNFAKRVDLSHLFRRSEEHTSELQSLMRTSYAVLLLKKKNTKTDNKALNSNNTIKTFITK